MAAIRYDAGAFDSWRYLRDELPEFVHVERFMLDVVARAQFSPDPFAVRNGIALPDFDMAILAY